MLRGNLRDWLTAARLPFTTVAGVPFIVAAIIAAKSQSVNWLAVGLGVVAVMCIMVTCHLIGEVYDEKEDTIGSRKERNPFAGGTLMVVNSRIDKGDALKVAAVLISAALVLGVAISLLHSSWLLLGLGALGGLAAVVYSLPPFRLVKRGLGEIIIGLVFGWLTVVTGYFCAVGELMPHSLLVGLPLMASVFNIILINQFPDYEPDRLAGKRNLVVRFGKPFGAALYTGMAVLTALALIANWHFFRSGEPLYLLAVAPAVLLALLLAFKVARGVWRDEKALVQVCGMGIILNHLCSVGLVITVSP
ncbi:MAG: prenyltransferase [Planctomycetota bacterium]|nr:prenyltransferase [Planctomycetota bacterium]